MNLAHFLDSRPALFLFILFVAVVFLLILRLACRGTRDSSDDPIRHKTIGSEDGDEPPKRLRHGHRSRRSVLLLVLWALSGMVMASLAPLIPFAGKRTRSVYRLVQEFYIDGKPRKICYTDHATPDAAQRALEKASDPANDVPEPYTHVRIWVQLVRF